MLHIFSTKKDGELQVRFFSLSSLPTRHMEEKVTRRSCRVNQQSILTQGRLTVKSFALSKAPMAALLWEKGSAACVTEQQFCTTM